MNLQVHPKRDFLTCHSLKGEPREAPKPWTLKDEGRNPEFSEFFGPLGWEDFVALPTTSCSVSASSETIVRALPGLAWPCLVKEMDATARGAIRRERSHVHVSREFPMSAGAVAMSDMSQEAGWRQFKFASLTSQQAAS